MSVVAMKQLLEAGVHFGHQTRRWDPRMAEYIFQARNGIHIIDLQKTSKKLDDAYEFVRAQAEEGKNILFFDNKYDLIKTFVGKRLKYYDIRKKRLIKILEEKLKDYEMRIKFIQLVIDKKIVVVQRKKQEILSDLKKYEIDSFVLDMKIWNLTSEKIDELLQKIKETKEELDYIKRTSIEDMYLYDLIDLRRNLCGIKVPA